MATSSTQRNYMKLTRRTRLRIYWTHHSQFILAAFILTCKIIIVAGLFLVIFSNHWARSSRKPYQYAGYKKRCSVHSCLMSDTDTTWLVDLVSVLAIVNLSLEFMYIASKFCFHCQRAKITTVTEELMFAVTFITTDCQVVFAIHIISHVYNLSMGYAYYVFLFVTMVSSLEWGLSLKRLTSDWPERICVATHQLSSPQPFRTYLFRTNPLRSIPEELVTSSNLITYTDSVV